MSPGSGRARRFICFPVSLQGIELWASFPLLSQAHQQGARLEVMLSKLELKGLLVL